MGRYREIDYRGKKFESVADFARHYGMEPELVLSRIHRGQPLEQAIENSRQDTRKIEVDGCSFISIADAARHFKISGDLAQSRLSRGWTPEQAFGMTQRARAKIGSRAKEIEVFGEKHPSLKLLAKHYGLTVAMIQHRVRVKKMSYEEAVSFQKVREISCHDVVYPSIASLARKYSINQGTLVSRIGRGMTPEQAVTAPILKYSPNKSGVIYLIKNHLEQKTYVGLTRFTPESRLKSHFKASRRGRGKNGSLHEAMRVYPHEAFTIEEVDRADNGASLERLEQLHIRKHKSLMPKGYNQNVGGAASGGQIKKGFKVGRKSFGSFAEACRHHGIDQGTCMNRLKRGWSAQKAFTQKAEVFDKSKPVKVFGKAYASLKEAADRNNADYKKVFHHVKYMNETPEQAIKGLAGKSRKITIEGVEYKYLKDACRAYGVKVTTVLARVRIQGMTREQAILVGKNKNQA
jgi:hypothetical protein